MEALKTVWNFIQDEVLGMNWLDRLLRAILNAVGLDTTGKIGSSIHFFIYDTIKIMVLLGVLILIISYIQSYFPPERTKKILGRFHGIGANIVAALLGTVTPFCSLLVHPVIYRLYKCGTSSRRNIFVPYFFTDGRSWQPCVADEYFRLEGCRTLCRTRSCHCCCRRHNNRKAAP